MKFNVKFTAMWRRALVVVLVPLAVVACGSDSDDEAIPSGGDTSAEIDGSTTTSDAVISAEDVDGADAEKVLLAAVLLGVGDVDVALSEGLVTADEVDLAAAALATGTLAEWADRANAGN